MPALLRVGSARTLEGGFAVTALTSGGGPTALVGVGSKLSPRRMTGHTIKVKRAHRLLICAKLVYCARSVPLNDSKEATS
jgi:hypothetical protein